MAEVEYRTSGLPPFPDAISPQSGRITLDGTRLLKGGKQFKFVGWGHARSFNPSASSMGSELWSDRFQNFGGVRIHGLDFGWSGYNGIVRFPRWTGATWSEPPLTDFKRFLSEYHKKGYAIFFNILQTVNTTTSGASIINANPLPGMEVSSGDLASDYASRKVHGYLQFLQPTKNWIDQVWPEVEPYTESFIWEVSNEDSMFTPAYTGIRQLKTLSAATQASAQASWNEWLVNEYGSDLAVQTAFAESDHDFSEKISHTLDPTSITDPLSSGDWTWATSGSGSVTWVFGSGLEVTHVSGSWTQIWIPTLHMPQAKDGMRYLLTFTLEKLSGDPTINVAASSTVFPTDTSALFADVTISLPSGSQTFNYYLLFTYDGPLTVRFQNKTAGTTVAVRNVSLTLVSTKSYPEGTESILTGTVPLPDETVDYIPKIAAAYKWWTNVERTFNEEVRDYIRTTYDPDALCISTSLFRGFANLLLALDIADHHLYGPGAFDSVVYPTDFAPNYSFAEMEDFLESLFVFVDGKPNVITEAAWGHANQYHAAFPILYAIICGLHDLDGFIIHELAKSNQGSGSNETIDLDIVSPFLIHEGNPVVNQLANIAAILLRNNAIAPCQGEMILTVNEDDIYTHYAQGINRYPIKNQSTPTITTGSHFWLTSNWEYIVNKLQGAINQYDILRYKFRMKLGDTTNFALSGSPDTRMSVLPSAQFSFADDQLCFLQVRDISGGGTYELVTPTQGTVTITVPTGQSGPGNFVIASLDGNPFSISNKIVVVAFGEVYNTGQTFTTNATGRRVDNEGSAPTLVTSLSYTLSLPSTWKRGSPEINI